MLDFFAERIAAALIGAVLGFIIAIALMVSVADLDHWWILVAVPIACTLVCALVGERAVEVFKQVAGFDT